ncbi:heme oxygenase-like protein [Schizopora paradoxa]|uniref:Heme oxygenase-like protein n=1 Tax=Schizopora paradoxa TaxID=27342 RepID=A0A0H2RG88_9AGAM|nr:heme oxygenase-like protein [Schizopora paradoxa]
MAETQLSLADASQASADLALPMSKVLRLATKEAHTEIESSDAASLLAHGKLSKEEYVRYLMMLYYVYDALEVALEGHATHRALEKTYNPTLLSRAPRLESDIAHLLDVPEEGWKSHPLHVAFRTSVPAALTAYVTRIQALSNGATPERLLGHAYVRYLGDLSGGQEIRRQVVKAYGLEGGYGTSFYSFSRLGEPGKEANVGDMAKIKEWFRDGMDEGVEEDTSMKGEIADEAVRAFRLSAGLFSAIQSPPEKDVSDADVVLTSKSTATNSFSTIFSRGLKNTFWSILRIPAQ